MVAKLRRSKSLPPMPTTKSSKPCFYYRARGGCKLGTFCRFRHATRYVTKVVDALPPPQITFEEAMKAARSSYVPMPQPEMTWRPLPMLSRAEKLERFGVRIRKEEREKMICILRQETLEFLWRKEDDEEKRLVITKGKEKMGMEQRRGELLELEQLMRFLFNRGEDIALWMRSAS